MIAPTKHSTRNCQPWFERSRAAQSGVFHKMTSAGLPFAPPVMLSSAWSFASTGKTAASARVTSAR